MHENHF